MVMERLRMILRKKKKNAQGTLKNTSAYFRNYSMKLDAVALKKRAG